MFNVFVNNMEYKTLVLMEVLNEYFLSMQCPWGVVVFVGQMSQIMKFTQIK